jgi:trehalose-phosphatase
MIPLDEKLRAAAVAPVLLVACDFDGTLAPIASTPQDVKPDEESLGAASALAQMPHTHAAVISGRALTDLSTRMKGIDGLWLVGSHGAEFDASSLRSLPPAVFELLARVRAEVVRITTGLEGAHIEDKPASVAFHFRNVEDSKAGPALESILHGPAAWDGVHTRPGLKVIELSVAPGDKGRALASIRHRVGATSVVFIGDDVTDEDAFAVLGGGDLAIKIGSGATRAEYRVGDIGQVPELLRRIMLLRNDWLQGRVLTPIEQHSMLSDQRTVAVIDPRGRVVWLCLPRVDSAALFSELLGGPSRGFLEVLPLETAAPPVQRYLGDSFVLETRWPGLVVTDYLDCCAGRPFQRAGRSDLVRVIHATAGPTKALIRFAPRLDFGRTSTKLQAREGGLEVEGSHDPIVLYAPGVTWKISDDGIHHAAEAEVALGDQPVSIEFRYGSGSLRPAVVPEPERRRQTERFWSGWAGTLQVPSIRPELVRRSALVLKALCHGPTGAMVAAATTSLPEQLGGIRNWDYRYCWPRDAALSAAALVRLGNTGTAMKLIDWLIGVVFAAESPDRLRPIYEVAGRELGPEAEIGDLAGYGASRPVRVGNAAAAQVQLDVFGPIVDLVAMVGERGAPVTPESWRLVEAMVNAVMARWMEPDHGIWEVRGPRRHHVYSKVMCWHAVNRAVVVAEHVMGKPRPAWEQLRDVIAADVLANGWNEQLQAFTGVYGGNELDAAVLTMGLCGMLSPSDHRFIATVDKTNADLRSGPVVYRYREDDGLPGIEGGLHICTFWLVEALALIGRTKEAHDLFESACALVGATGMLSEEYEPNLKIALGNVPQAYSHLGLINAAVRLGMSNK